MKAAEVISTHLFEPLVPEDAEHVPADLATELVGKSGCLAGARFVKTASDGEPPHCRSPDPAGSDRPKSSDRATGGE
jgi:hypothetical protein